MGGWQRYYKDIELLNYALRCDKEGAFKGLINWAKIPYKNHEVLRYQDAIVGVQDLPYCRLLMSYHSPIIIDHVDRAKTLITLWFFIVHLKICNVHVDNN